ncbi:hypothetical protein KC19_VG172500 [Ceratodon purpureus]|uniref:Uncharacterized protein n=1 Tax=Ceratodon purpureus TaxID=3225 RepID=A0A8T0HQW5_CERPU|nr:hypothetical protein KC19_VG172200 [Ceratodon purpureus]KAG0573370.1 hypothetical protein KC19_VG172500 [Ceratodon purpureus]
MMVLQVVMCAPSVMTALVLSVCNPSPAGACTILVNVLAVSPIFLVAMLIASTISVMVTLLTSVFTMYDPAPQSVVLVMADSPLAASMVTMAFTLILVDAEVVHALGVSADPVDVVVVHPLEVTALIDPKIASAHVDGGVAHARDVVGAVLDVCVVVAVGLVEVDSC